MDGGTGLMPIDFPAEPAVGDAYTFNNRTWLWSGEVWTPDRAKYTVDRDIVTDVDGYLVASVTTSTEVGYLAGVTSSVQVQLDEKAPSLSPVFTGDPTAPTANANQSDAQVATTAFVIGQAASVAPLSDGASAAIGTSVKYARQDHVHPTDTSLATKASPTFTGTVTVAAEGIQFTDGVQLKQGTPSLTVIKPAITSNATTSTLSSPLTYRDALVAVAGAFTITVDPDTTNSVTFPIGTSLNFYQSVGTGGASIVAVSASVTLLVTPGLVFRDLNSSVSLTKIAANTWLVFGDLKA
jgi:hypothetical protein